MTVPAKEVRSAISVLIVDDEAHVRLFLKVLLESLGVVHTWQARDGLEALDIYREHQPDLVLLDVNMPNMAGPEVFRRIVEIDPQAVIAVATSHSDHGMVRTFQELGAIGYVIKHAPKDTVATALAEVLDRLIDCDESEEEA
jgi:YesN/AraC family two-component response regulator